MQAAAGRGLVQMRASVSAEAEAQEPATQAAPREPEFYEVPPSNRRMKLLANIMG